MSTCRIPARAFLTETTTPRPLHSPGSWQRGNRRSSGRVDRWENAFSSTARRLAGAQHPRLRVGAENRLPQSKVLPQAVHPEDSGQILNLATDLPRSGAPNGNNESTDRSERNVPSPPASDLWKGTPRKASRMT